MEISTEVISISKIRDGIFIGDMRAGINLDLLMQFKISHIINATGMQLPYTFESIGIKDLTIEWSENPKEETTLITNDIATKIISFIDDSLINGEGLFGFSFNGKNRICVVIVIYLMTKFMWPLKKCYEYVKKKKADIDINTYYKNQLTEYEKKLFENDNTHIVQPKLFWNLENLKDKNELLMRNTYMNEVKNYKINLENNNLEENKMKIIRHVEWGDNKKYARQMIQPGLIHYNIDKDLFLKKNIEDITEHLHNKPLRSCIKNSSNMNLNSNTSSTIRRKRKNTKIYLAADVNPTNNSNKNSVSNTNNINNSHGEECNDEILTLRHNNNNDNKNNNEKKHIFENILNNEKKDNEIKEDIKEKVIIKKKYENEEDEKESSNKKNIYSSKNYENSENHIVNNLFITSTKIGENDSDDEIKLNNIINIKAKNKENNEIKNNNNDGNNENKNNNENKKDLGFNIINIESQKYSNNNIKPILNNLLKIDPNLQTLKKYLKANKKKTLTNFANTFPNFKISNTNKDKNINIKTITDNNNSPTINTISNNNDTNNSNTVNLIPIQMNKNINNQNKGKKILKKEEKKNNGIYLLNFNLNIDNRTTLNIKNNIINNGNNGFNKKLNNFFMDSNGNSYFNSFNKFKNRRSNTSESKDTINNHKYLSPNVNYYLGKQEQNKRKEEIKKENIIIPNIALNNNNYSINNPRNINKNEKGKIFMRQNINIDRNNINNMINNNKNNLINNISNSNGFNRKESKFIILIFYNIL